MPRASAWSLVVLMSACAGGSAIPPQPPAEPARATPQPEPSPPAEDPPPLQDPSPQPDPPQPDPPLVREPPPVPTPLAQADARPPSGHRRVEASVLWSCHDGTALPNAADLIHAASDYAALVAALAQGGGCSRGVEQVDFETHSVALVYLSMTDVLTSVSRRGNTVVFRGKRMPYCEGAPPPPPGLLVVQLPAGVQKVSVDFRPEGVCHGPPRP